MKISKRVAGTLILASVLSVSARAQTLLYHLEDPAPDVDLGPSVARLGDIDHDGVLDFATSGMDQVTHLGRLTVFSGADTSVLYVVQGTLEYAGCLMSDCGDVDLDGTPDFLVSGMWGGPGEGPVRLVSGANGSKLLEWSGDDPSDQFGAAVAGAGDLDADGVPDVIIGAPQYTIFPPFPPGYVRAYSGATGAQLFHWSGTPPGQLFGYAVDRAGDVNGDGHADVAISTDHNTVDIYSGFDGSLLRSLDVESWAWSLRGGRDVTGDGVPDIVAGSPNWGSGIESDLGRVTVWSGADGSLFSEVRGSHAEDYLGDLVDFLDDVDGDGLPDVLTSAYNYGPLSGDRGVVLAFPGKGGPALFNLQSIGEEQYWALGTGLLATLGDLTGDGRAEFGVGTGNYVNVYTTDPQPPTLYCTAKINSQGCLPQTSWSGTPSLSGPDDYLLHCDKVLNGTLGVLAWSFSAGASPFLGGTLCIGAPRSVGGVTYSGGSTSGHDCSGVLSVLLSQDALSSGGMQPGMGLYAQFFYRDRTHPDGTGAGLSQGVYCNVLP